MKNIEKAKPDEFPILTQIRLREVSPDNAVSRINSGEFDDQPEVLKAMFGYRRALDVAINIVGEAAGSRLEFLKEKAKADAEKEPEETEKKGEPKTLAEFFEQQGELEI